jgi:hypothetical protein
VFFFWPSLVFAHSYLTESLKSIVTVNFSVKMNVMALNFLQHKPSEDWVDFFVNYNKFLELLQNENAGNFLAHNHCLQAVFRSKVNRAII